MLRSQNKWELDVQGFLNACAITAALPRQQIRNFAQGINQLGLWNSMVCWPLRSSQNAATDNIMFSLGGLGTFNGTMTNGPVRGADGMTFDGVDDFIVNSAIVDNAGGTLFSAAYTSIAAAGGSEGRLCNFSSGIELGHSRISSTAYGAEAYYLSSPFDGAGRGVNPSPASSTLSRWFTVCGVFNNNASIARFVDGAAKVSTNIATTYLSRTGINIGRRTGGSLYWNGQIATAAYFAASLSDGQVASLHDLYKSTLGQGLGLP